MYRQRRTAPASGGIVWINQPQTLGTLGDDDGGDGDGFDIGAAIEKAAGSAINAVVQVGAKKLLGGGGGGGAPAPAAPAAPVNRLPNQTDPQVIEYWVALHTPNPDPAKTYAWGWSLQSVRDNAAAIEAEVQRRGLAGQAQATLNAALAPTTQGGGAQGGGYGAPPKKKGITTGQAFGIGVGVLGLAGAVAYAMRKPRRA